MTTNPPTNRTPHPSGESLPPGTRVLNTDDGEDGSILSAVAWDHAGNWTEYEVVTAYGIEIWKVGEFIRFDEFAAA